MKKMSKNRIERLQKKLPVKCRFFEPFVGAQYSDGIKGKKILVLNSGSHCNSEDCSYSSFCTNILTKTSLPFEKKCPMCKSLHRLIQLEPKYSIEDTLPSHQQFASYMSQFLGQNDYKTIWSHLAYTNYIQYMLPRSSQMRDITWSHLTEHDFSAFREVLEELQPDVVVIWGKVVAKRLQAKNQFLVDVKELENSEDYVCHIKIPSMEKKVAIISSSDPSSITWESELEHFDKHFLDVLTQPN